MIITVGMMIMWSVCRAWLPAAVTPTMPPPSSMWMPLTSASSFFLPSSARATTRLMVSAWWSL